MRTHRNTFVISLIASLVVLFGFKHITHANDCLPIDEKGKRIDYPSMLFGCNRDELRTARNQIYAYYGYDFKDPELKERFKIYSWHKPAGYFDFEAMSEKDKQIVDHIKREEEVLDRIPDRALFLKGYSLFKPEIADFTIVYGCVERKGKDSYGNKNCEAYIFAIIPGFLKSEKEALDSWENAEYLALMDDYSFPIHSERVNFCNLKQDLINEPHICVDFNGPSDDPRKLFIGWKDGRFTRTGHVWGYVTIDDYTNSASNSTNLFVRVWSGSYDLKQLYIYDHDKDTIEFSHSIWPIFMNYECYAREKTFFHETAESAADKSKTTNRYFYQGETLNVTLVDCGKKYGECVFLINSHSRPKIRGWVDEKSLPCYLPAAG